DLKKAVDYIRTHLAGKMPVADLIAYCGVPERTLRKHFRAFMAASPLEFWRHLRLAAARECFLEGSNGTSVTEVATRFGFDHFDRFAQHYRDRFAETPTATLQRSRFGKQDRRQRRSEGRSVPTPKSSRDRPSIAVLPFQNSGASNACKAIG